MIDQPEGSAANLANILAPHSKKSYTVSKINIFYTGCATLQSISCYRSVLLLQL